MITSIDGLKAQPNQTWAVFYAGDKEPIVKNINDIRLKDEDHIVFLLISN